MRKLLLPVLVLLLAAGCKKNEDNTCDAVTDTAPAAEVATLRQYLTNSGITATEDSRGFFYTIVTAGSSTPPSPCATVDVNYEGRLTNGAMFDHGSNVSLSLTGLIKGWREGIPHTSKGGRIILYLPPSLGYGAQAAGLIPANSITIFTIDLLDFS